MNDASKAKAKRKRSRSPLLAGLLAVVAVIAMWLADCIPGFGIGAGSKEGEGEIEEASEPAQPAEPEPEPEPAADPEPTVKPRPMKLTIDARGCLVDGGEPIDCASLCDDEARFANVDALIIDAKDGPQAAVEAALDCAKAKGLSVKITRE